MPVSRRSWVAATALAAAALAGCTSVPAGGGPTADRPARPPVAPLAAWAVTGGLLSVIVRNPGPSAITSARAVITARDRHGNAVATVSGPGSAGCCAVASVAPGRSYGVATDLGAAAARVRSVTVRYVDLVTAAPGPPPAAVGVENVVLQTDDSATVVRAALTSSVTGAVRPQAVLRGPGGRLVAVLAGPARCLAAGEPTQVTLTFEHRVSAGTVVGSLEAFTLAADPGGPCPPS